MPRRSRVARSQAQLDPSPGLVTGAASDLDAYDAVESLLSEIPAASSCMVHVYKFRETPQGQKFDRCRRVPLADFDVDKLPLMFGGGEFTLRIIDRENQIDRTARVSFDPALYPVPGSHTPPTASAPGGTAPQGAAAPGVIGSYDDRLSRLEGALREAQDRHVRFLESLLTQGGARTASADPLPMIKAVMEIVNGAGGGSRTPAKEILDSIKAAFELARDAGDGRGPGSEGGGDWLMSVIEKLGPKLLEGIMAAAPRRPALAGAAAPGPPAVSPAPGVRATVPAGPTSMFGIPENPPAGNGAGGELPAEWAQFLFLRNYTDLLIDAARRHTDPGFVADLTYRKVPEKHLDALETFVYLPPEARAGLCAQLDPRLAPCAGYIEEVAEAIRGEFEDDAAQEEQGPRANATPTQ
jgi:hypothetical protein